MKIGDLRQEMGITANSKKNQTRINKELKNIAKNWEDDRWRKIVAPTTEMLLEMTVCDSFSLIMLRMQGEQ